MIEIFKTGDLNIIQEFVAFMKNIGYEQQPVIYLHGETYFIVLRDNPLGRAKELGYLSAYENDSQRLAPYVKMIRALLPTNEFLTVEG